MAKPAFEDTSTLPLRSLYDGTPSRRDSDNEVDHDAYDEVAALAIDKDELRDLRDRPEGRVELICGPMWAGKSTELLRRVRRYSITHKNLVVFTHQKDVRFGEDMGLTTHDVMEEHKAASFQVFAVTDLLEGNAASSAERASVIAIDEGQFFMGLPLACNKWADEGKIVIVAALDTDYKREVWAPLIDLCPDTITKLMAICFGCGGEAAFTRRTSDETELEVVGGKGKYEAVCRACYVAGTE